MNTVSESQENYRDQSRSAADVHADKLKSLKDKDSMKGLPYEQLIATGTEAQKKKASNERFITTSAMMLGTSEGMSTNAKNRARAARLAAENASSRYGTSAQAANSMSEPERTAAFAESKGYGRRRDGQFTKGWKGKGLGYRANTQSVSAQAKVAVAAQQGAH